MESVVFLQARLGSARLPHKALARIGQKSMLEHAMDSLKKVIADEHVLLTDQESLESFTPLAENCCFKLFVGDPDDVLLRFAQALEQYPARWIIRATGDNPFVSDDLANLLFSSFKNSDNDYCAFRGMPLGTGVELCRSSALLKANKEAVKRYDREHVMPYLYNNPDLFKIALKMAPSDYIYEQARVTVDTAKDLQDVRHIYHVLDGRVDCRGLVSFLKEMAYEKRA